MKKFFAIIFTIFYSFCRGQADSLTRTPGADFEAGPYMEYYASGKIKLKGLYKLTDSIECVNCFDKSRNIKVTKAHTRLMRADEWIEYHENGKIKAMGFYKGIHETTSIVWPKDYGKAGKPFWVPGGYIEEYLKDKNWQYFDAEGRLIREEYYFNGVLADVIHYEH